MRSPDSRGIALPTGCSAAGRPVCFRRCNPAPYTFGNSPRSGLRGAPVVTTDLTLEKSFAITERFRLDLRCEFYNVLNRAIFNVPDFTLGDAAFGAVTS